MSRKHLMTLLIASIVIFANCTGSGDRQTGSEGWVSFNEGIEAASRTGKPVIIDFYTSWCKWCKVMDKETFSDPEVKEYLEKNFVTIRINAENRTDQLKFKGRTFTPVELTRSFGVRGYPSLAYLESEGEIIMVIPGFKKPDVFMPTLRYINDGCYKNGISLDDYIKKNEDCGSQG